MFDSAVVLLIRCFAFLQVLVPFIKSLVVLDADGDRLFAKYYDGRKKPEQITNEATLFKKTKTVTAKSEGSSTCNSLSFVTSLPKCDSFASLFLYS